MKKLKLIYTKGLPASGKTTWAEAFCKVNSEYCRVNKDEIRKMLSRKSKNFEAQVLKVRDDIIWDALNERQLNVICDDTNLNPIHVARFNELADLVNEQGIYSVTVECKDFTDVPLDVCIARDAQRPNPVGKGVITGMYNQYLKPKWTQKPSNDNLPPAIIVDLDGNLSLIGDKNKIKSEFDRDYENDTVNLPVLAIVQWALRTGIKVLFTSGRKQKFRFQTVEFLTQYIDYNSDWLLFMRQDDDNRRDNVVKLEIYENHIVNKFNVLFAIDDRKRVVEAWRSIGIFTFDTNQTGVDY